MIYVFRKEMKKWHSVLWVVLASIAITAGVGMFTSRKDPADIPVIIVNGKNILMKEYRQALSEVNMQIDMYKAYAKMYGIPVDMFLGMSGLNNPTQAAFDQSVRDALLDQAKNKFNVQLDSDYFEEELAKSLPAQVKNQQGDLDMQAYKFYLNRLGTSITDFEKSTEDAMERALFQAFIKESSYVPLSKLRSLFIDKTLNKKFAILEFPFDSFLKNTNAKTPSKEVLNKFFEDHKEKYRVPEKRKVAYWMISPEKYAEKIIIDDEVIESFYDRNKSSLFRIAPKVKVRRIQLKANKDADAKELEKTLDNARVLHKKAIQKPEDFTGVAKTEVIDFFDKGTYAPEFEAAAFRLQSKNDISDIVKTKDGYEIIQLIERKAASEKPLDSVRNEIVKTIKARKALVGLKSELEKVLYESKKDKNALNEFVKKNSLKAEQTGLLVKQDAVGAKLENVLAEKAFTAGKKANVQGYFPHEKSQILYQLLVVELSLIPKFDDVEKEIVQDYYQDSAKKDMRAALKKAQLELLSNKASTDTIAKDMGLKLINTDMVGKYGEIKDLKSGRDLLQRAFILEDKSEVLRLKQGLDSYLVKLIDTQKVEDGDIKTVRDELLKDEKTELNNQYLESFIASLWRNAKIEKVEKMLNVNTK